MIANPEMALALHRVCETYGLDPVAVMAGQAAEQGFRMALLAKAMMVQKEMADG